MKITIEIGSSSFTTEMTMENILDHIPQATQQALAEHYSECGSICEACPMLYGLNDLPYETIEKMYGEAFVVCSCGRMKDLLKIDAATILMASLEEKNKDIK